jgi:hypothetical protein
MAGEAGLKLELLIWRMSLGCGRVWGWRRGCIWVWKVLKTPGLVKRCELRYHVTHKEVGAIADGGTAGRLDGVLTLRC